MSLSSFQKYTVCYGCKVVINFMATTISTNFPLFPSMLAPFSQISKSDGFYHCSLWKKYKEVTLKKPANIFISRSATDRPQGFMHV